MIERDFDFESGTGQFLLRPQRSATWRENLWLIAAVAATAVPIALIWTVAGFWPVLLVCVAHLVMLTAGLYVVSHALLARELIVIGPSAITIEAGRRQVDRRFELGRTWARVDHRPRRHRWGASRLIVQSDGRAVELGRFLTEEEREALAAELRAALMVAPRQGARA